jgi:iron complex transport system substrate-binding protein
MAASPPSQRLARRASALCVRLLFLFAACTQAATTGYTTATDDRGRAQTFTQPPQRIISLLPSLTESVCVLGACDRLVAVDRYSDWPAAVQRLPRVGGLDDAVVERIVALKPDLVLAATSTRAVARLEGLGVKVIAFDSDTQEQVHRSLKILGDVLDSLGPAGPSEPGARGEATWQRIQAQISRAERAVPPLWKGRTVYLEVDPGPYAASAGSFVGQTLHRLGLVNIAPARLGPFPKLNPEAVVKARPQMILMGEASAVDLPQRPGWQSIPAVQRRQVCALPEASFRVLTRPGPRLGEAADVIVACLKRWPDGPELPP